MKTLDPLLAEIEDFCRETAMAESTFGRVVVNDGKLVSRLRRGGDVTRRTERRIRQFIEDRRAA